MNCSWQARLLVAAAAFLPFAVWADASDDPDSVDRQRVLLIGDSFVKQSFGRGLEQELSDAGFSVLRRGQGSTGLSRPDFFDWWREGSRLVEQHDPAVIIVMMGGNDGQDLLDRNGRSRVRWGDAEWRERYLARIDSFLYTLGAGSRTVLWVELPPMRGRRFERKVEYIRGIQREVLARTPSAHYVPTGDLLRDAAGRVLRTLSRGSAIPYPVHDGDGIHLTPKAGWTFAQLVAPRLLPEIERMEPGSRDDSADIDPAEASHQVPLGALTAPAAHHWARPVRGTAEIGRAPASARACTACAPPGEG